MDVCFCDSRYLTITFCIQLIDKKQPTGFWLSKPIKNS